MPSYRILITTGDIDGIGFEVTAKALAHLGPQKNISYFVYYNSQKSLGLESFLNRKFHSVVCSSLDEAIDFDLWNRKQKRVQKPLVLIDSKKRPALWVEEAARACLLGHADAMVTAPLSKPEIRRAGLKDLGHTDILKRICKTKTAFMGFFGPEFNVILATGHVPTAQAERSLLKSSLLKKALQVAKVSRNSLAPKDRKKPVGVLGLNPHAGDAGLIGKFDQAKLSRLIKGRKEFVGPLVPDSAFQKKDWSKYSFYLAMYHDQGLIPFKMIHGHDVGTHVTLGLPIVRTSVDHGTAKDIFGKNKANPGSMIDAIRWALRLSN